MVRRIVLIIFISVPLAFLSIWAQDFSKDSILSEESIAPYGITYDGTNFWYLDSRRRALYKSSPDGRKEVYRLNLPYLSGIDFDPLEGRIYVAGPRILLKIDPVTGGVTDRISIPIDKIAGVANYSGLLYLLDAESGKVSIYDKAMGQIVGGFGTDRSKPKDICYAKDSIWVTDAGDGFIYRYNPESGKITGSVKTPGKDIRGMTLVDSDFYVVDSTLRKIYRVLFLETDRFLVSGESNYKVTVSLDFKLDYFSVAGGKLAILDPPTTEHQRIRRMEFQDSGFRPGFILGQRVHIQDLAIEERTGQKELQYTFLVRAQNVRYYVADDFLQTKENYGSDLEVYRTRKINFSEKNNSYVLDKIFNARLFQKNMKSLEESMLESGLAVRNLVSVSVSDKAEILEGLEVAIPAYGWVPVETIQLRPGESSRAYRKEDSTIDLFRSYDPSYLETPVLYQGRESETWDPVPARISVKVEVIPSEE